MDGKLDGELEHEGAWIFGEKGIGGWCWVEGCDDDDDAWEMLGLLGGARIDLSFLHVNRCLDGITGVGED